jgi:hypothetical protein
MIVGRAEWFGVVPQAQETVMEQSTRFIGMDVHKDTIVQRFSMRLSRIRN